MTPPTSTSPTAESLADLVYRAQVAAPGKEPTRRSLALGWSVCAYAAIALALAIGAPSAAPPIVLPKLAGTVTLFEASTDSAPRDSSPGKSSVQLPSQTTPLPLPLEAPAPPVEAGFAPLPSTLAPAQPAPPAPSGSGSDHAPATAPRFDAAYLNNPDPAYPVASRRIGEEGRVILRVLVSALGQAEQVEVRTSSGSSRLDQAALSAVKRWRFEPARQGDSAIQAWVLVPISFHLDA
ncbi:MAG: energy transducer TonB [Acidobacteria bacterium]|nr:energy transducer TonB [Acidobacteriota bacterium]